MDEFSLFLREGGNLDPQVDSGFSLQTRPKRKWRARRQQWQWHAIFLVLLAPRAVLHTGEVCTVNASVEQFPLEFWASFF